MADNAKTITVELTEEEARLVMSGLALMADTVNSDEKNYMAWTIISKIDL